MIKRDFKIHPTKTKNPKDKTGRILLKSVTTGIKIFLVILSIFGLFLFYVWQHSQIDRLTRELEELNQQARALQNSNERLKASISVLSSYNRIERIAREQLQMKPVQEKPSILQIAVPENAEFTLEPKESSYLLQSPDGNPEPSTTQNRNQSPGSPSVKSQKTPIREKR